MFSKISIIIPLAGDEPKPKALLESLPEEAEIIICFDGTRAKSMNMGARQATRKFLWFLHADSLLTDECLPALKKALSEQPKDFHFFTLAFSGDSSLMKINQKGVKIRANIAKLPFGDQGFLMHKELFTRLGTYDESARYGEDHLLVWKAHQLGIRVNALPATLLTSPRKYMQRGWLKITLLHQFLFWKQAIPQGLKRLFTPVPKNIAIAVFVKTPTFSPIKTRLAKSIGKDKAEEFYKLSLQATEHAVAQASLNNYWAIAEEEAISHPLWQNFNRLQSGSGDLGARLHHVYSTLIATHDAVILLGADCPHMPTSAIDEALTKLKSNPFIFGASHDGGFYLFASNTHINKDVWLTTTYSKSTTQQELASKLGYSDIAYIKPLTDVDDLKSLQALDQILNSRKRLSFELNAIKQWITTIY